MAIRTWKFQSGKREHVVVLKHNPWSGRRVLTLDGREIMNEAPWDNLRHSYKFACERRDCEVTVGRSYLVWSVNIRSPSMERRLSQIQALVACRCCTHAPHPRNRRFSSLHPHPIMDRTSP